MTGGNTDRTGPEILIFAGTTEGRELAEYASARSIRCFVSTATGYGKSLLDHLDCITVLSGRMEEQEIREFLEEQEIRLVIDATHPFALTATENIRNACEMSARGREIRYVRCIRRFGEKQRDKDILYVDSVQAAVNYLKNTEGNILIATGSKELHLYTEIENYRKRCFARVLSTEPAVAQSVRLGFEGKHLFAMQGPFGTDMNLALLRQTEAVYFVTKESGRAGGFEEKAEAAEEAGAVLVVVGRPEETGNSPEEVKELLRGYDGMQDA